MKKRIKSMLRVFLWVAAIIVILICICFGYHRYRLRKEEKLREPLGQLIDINENNISIYVEGSGSKTLVFLSGGGTCSPILDFKSLYSLLSDEYRIIVVEKFGYGYSDIVDEDRNIQTILSETRLALNKAGIEGPYVLCPHSMSGIEALYWAQKYPDEIEAIIGLDMAVPEYYENMKINLALMKLGQYAADLGITRLIPTLAESDAIKHGTLTNDEKNRYRAIFYNRTATVTMINEAKSVKDNARIVAQNGVPQVPMLLFISDGTGGTGFDKETWRRIQEKYISEVEYGKYIELDCPHYVHDYEYGRISEEIKSFLSD
ncbi:alpha/beta hydrolase [Roseburia intestinalis]|jgi:pimeloyl-ACP methyl ester carboxylesterase|uniref:Alpha/beta hydrolase n=1 Tax=Roseburia intestinalis TaxID=166486 RepID=A0A3R6KPC8_9FIRM|nr:alpha/beta hydrolase [Roseburia intestinalis]RHC16456.1 alpha/beta hydrolase [Roseburia intestinalis]RHN03639.1 alpha/beta hydrolase [Roseburia intestinalis]